MTDEPGRRERKRARTRSTVVTVAQELFRDRGFEHTTIEDVARAADVAVQTVFNHVSSKEELFFADRVPWAVMIGSAPCPAPGEDWAEALVRQLTEASVGYLGGLADPAYLDMAAQVESVPALNRYERAVHTRAEESLAGHLATAGVSSHPRLTAALLLATTRVHAHEHRQRVIAGTPLAESLEQVGRMLPGYLGQVLSMTSPVPA